MRLGYHGRTERSAGLKMTTISTYIIHVYKIRPLSGIVEEHVILLDETLTDRLVLRVYRHDAARTRGIAETVLNDRRIRCRKDWR